MPNKKNDNIEEVVTNQENSNVENTSGVNSVEVSPDVPEDNDTIQFDSPDLDEGKDQKKEKKSKKSKSFEEDQFELLVEETLRGVHGSGRERMISLGEDYAKVQKEVNRRQRQQ